MDKQILKTVKKVGDIDDYKGGKTIIYLMNRGNILTEKLREKEKHWKLV